MPTPGTRPTKPEGFPLFPHSNGQWAKKIKGKLHYFGPWADPGAALAKYLDNSQKQGSIPDPAQTAKPAKPHPDYPLYAHASGQWAKKIRGKTHFFGKWADPQAALEKWLVQKDALLAGRIPTPATDRLTVRDAANMFLIFKRERVDTGELRERTWQDYKVTVDRVIAVLGTDRLVADLWPDDFGRLRNAFAKGRGLVSLWDDVTRARVFFRHIANTYRIAIAYGGSFDKPKKKELRKARREKGPRMFQADEIRQMVDGAGVQLKAMILLGVNCGFGNTDVGTLPLKALDLENGWVDYPRPKTETPRRCHLWPETVAALREAIAVRPKSPLPNVFITVKGHSWESKMNYGEGKTSRGDPVAGETAKLLRRLGLHRPGLGFYALRHTFQTIGERGRDKDAVRHVMGHTPAANDMSAVYSEEAPDDARLRAVADYVHDWLFSSKPAAPEKGAPVSAGLADSRV